MAGSTVLIVDDEIIIARDLEARLSRLGYEVVGIASTGSEAIALAEKLRPSLVLMDIVLKGALDGIEAATEIRHRWHLPVIYITAYADRGTLERAKVTEPFAYIVKPFSERELHANLEMALYKHRIEQRTRRLESWFGLAIDDVTDAVVTTDREGQITMFNVAAEDLTAWPRAEALGRPMTEVIRLVDRASGRPISMDGLAEAPVVSLSSETWLLNRNGRRVPVNSTTSRLRDEDGQDSGAVAILRDANGPRNAALVALNGEVAVAAARETGLRELLQSCTEAFVRHLDAAFARIWLLDPAGETLVLEASSGMYTHLDGSHGRIRVGQFKIGWIAQERKPHVTNDVQRDPRVSNHEWARREGMVAFAGYPLTIGDRLLGVVAMFSRHHLHDSVLDALGSTANTIAVAVEIRQSRRHLESVLASSPAVLYRLAGPSTDRLRLTWISSNVNEMMGDSVADVMAPTWWHDHLHPSERQQVYAQISSELLSVGRLTQEYRFRHHDGRFRWVRSEMRLLHDVPGEAVEVVGSWSDITSRKALEEQFRQAQKMEAIGQLAGGVAHDFNNLLTVISGYSQILLGSSELDERKRGLALEISKAGERAASLTRQLLAFSRKQLWEPRLLDLNAVITDQQKMLSRLIGEDIEFVTVLDPALYKVKTDLGQFEQVIMNLVVNARDAMPRGGRLVVETRNAELDASYTSAHAGVEPGPYAMVTVSDTGCGMPPEVLEHLFEPFFTTKGQGSGTGLGLATVYGIVQQSGGHVAVYSEPGQGTTFKLYLPPAVGSTVASRGAGDQTRPMPTGHETILLVEDEGAVRAIVRHTLESCGYTVLEATNGADGLRRCEEHEGRIDLLVTDVVMPEMPGRVLAEKLAKLRPETKVLFMSGYTDDAVIRQGIMKAETAFLQKPFTPRALAEKVRQVLG